MKRFANCTAVVLGLVLAWSAATAAVVPVADAPAGVMQVVRLDDFPEGDVDWDFLPGQEFPGAKGSVTLVKDGPAPGQNAIKLTGDFTKGGMYVAANKQLPVDVQETAAIKFKIKSANTTKFSLRLVDSTGQCFQKKGFPLEPDGQWHDFTIAPASLAGVEHWGGANDGQWHGPARLLSLLIDKGSAQDKQPFIELGDMRSEVLVGATVQPAAYSEDFEKAAVPASWKVAGNVMLDKAEAFKGLSCLTLKRGKADMDRQATTVLFDPFPVKPGTWELTAAMKSSLYSPDSSYNGSATLDALDGSGKTVQSFELGIITGDHPWQPFKKTVELPAAAISAQFKVAMNKSYGKFSVDELSAASVNTSRRAVPSVTALKFSASALNTNALGHLFYPGDKVQFVVTAECAKPLPGATGEVTCVVKDYWGAELSEPIPVKLEKAGKPVQHKFRYTGQLDLSGVKLEPGKYYEIHGELPDPTLGEAYRNWSSFAILPVAITKKYKPFDIPFTSRDWDNRIKEYFLLSDRLGVRVCGVWSGWNAKPPYASQAPGIELCKQLGMGALLGTPGNTIERRAKGYKDYDETALREGAKKLVEKYKNELPIAVYLGNEPHAADDEQAKEMIAAYKAMYEGVKAADPNVTVIGTSCGADEIFFKNGFQPWQDVYDFHAYEDSKVIRAAFARYRDLFAKYPGSAKPIWSTEIGLNSQGMSRQAITMDLIKKFAYFFADGGANMSWFDLLYPDPAGTQLGSNAESFNVFDSRYNFYAPKLDAIAYYNMVNGICVKKFAAEKLYNGDVRAFLFRDTENRCLQVLWKDKGRQEVSVPLAGVKAVRVIRIDGSSAELNAANQGVTLSLDEDPLLLLYESPAKELPAELGAPVVALAADPDPVIKGGSITLKFTAPDEVMLAALPFWGVKQTGPTMWALTAPERTTAREGRIVASLKNGAGELYFSVPVTGLLEARLLAAPMTGTNTAGVKLVVKNNGREKQTVQTHLAIENEIPMEHGMFKLKSPVPTKAYFTDSADATLELDGRQERELTVPVAGLDAQTLYRLQAMITDASGRTVKRERFMAGFAGVPRASEPVIVDGVLDDPAWQTSPVQRINEARQFFGFGKPPREWQGPADLSGEVRFLWDDRYLYVGVKVTDNVFHNEKQNGEIWAGDGLQFLIDPFRESPVKGGKYEYNLAVGAKGPQVWSDYIADSGVPLGEIKEIKFAAKPAGDGTGGMTYEIAIPWSHLAPFQPAPGRNLGLAAILNDDDGKGRDCFMGWFSGVHSKEVDMLGDLILGK